MKPNRDLLTALDIGSSKICCLIARRDDSGRLTVIGIGHQVAKGMHRGSITELEAAEMAVRAAVEQAEKMADATVSSVLVNISGGQVSSELLPCSLKLEGRIVTRTDLAALEEQAQRTECAVDKAVLHTIATGYTLDTETGIKNPLGMMAETLSASITRVLVQQSVLHNLLSVIERCHLDALGVNFSAYASGLSCLAEDEMDLGVTLLDFGGGTTTIAGFYDSALVYTASIPIGGHHITRDLARGLSTPLIHAERLKNLYGSATRSARDSVELIDVPLIGEDELNQSNQQPRATLVDIIRPRIDEILELISRELTRSGMQSLLGRRCVITGGGAQLPGLRDVVAVQLDKNVRVGRPLRVQGLPDATSGPAFATATGLLECLQSAQAITHRHNRNPIGGVVGRWFKDWL